MTSLGRLPTSEFYRALVPERPPLTLWAHLLRDEVAQTVVFKPGMFLAIDPATTVSSAMRMFDRWSHLLDEPSTPNALDIKLLGRFMDLNRAVAERIRRDHQDYFSDYFLTSFRRDRVIENRPLDYIPLTFRINALP